MLSIYDKTAFDISRIVTIRYSTSFGTSAQLFSKEIQPHIYAIYALVRIADEIVDTDGITNQSQRLNELEEEVYQAIESGYSANIIVHAFSITARTFGITKELISPFFDSMRMDTTPQIYTRERYEKYIYGSAEVIGLMCLRVFLHNNEEGYLSLEKGARALGAAYQKINFLRDFAADYNTLHRVYFPGVSFESFDEVAKKHIIDEIKADFDRAQPALNALPKSSRRATQLSLKYYVELLRKLEHTPATTIKKERIRIHNFKKFMLFLYPNNSTAWLK